MEILTGRDSAEISENITQDTTKVDWARLLLDRNTDDMIITVSREKIAHEIIKLRNENKSLRSTATNDTYRQSEMSQRSSFIPKVSMPSLNQPRIAELQNQIREISSGTGMR